MSQGYNTLYAGFSHKNCATCNHWGGDRKYFEGKKAAVPSPTTSGQCPIKKQNTLAEKTCDKWEKWASLR